LSSARASPEQYQARVQHVLALAGSSDSGARESAIAILGLEKRLADVSLDAKASADPAATDHPMTFTQLEQLAPGVDWKAYFAEAGLPHVDLNVEQPKLLQRLDVELRETPPLGLEGVPPLEVARFRLALPVEVLRRPHRDDVAWTACVESTESLFGDALGRKYVERHFPPAAKAKAQEIVRALLTVLKQDVAGLQWMRLETRKTALEKLEGFDAQVGYPERWMDYAGVKVHRDTFWANVVAGRRFNVAANRKRIGKPTERDLWQLPPSSPEAYIDLQLNQMVLPAGFLRPPAFGIDQGDAQNYGAIGTSIAHDLTHGIDVGGSETRPPWASPALVDPTDRQEFERRGRCVSDQFEGYFIEPGLHHRGNLVLSEAIGDLPVSVSPSSPSASAGETAGTGA
jgi:endothelin-converting enzyme/putative endopeptidase